MGVGSSYPSETRTFASRALRPSASNAAPGRFESEPVVVTIQMALRRHEPQTDIRQSDTGRFVLGAFAPKTYPEGLFYSTRSRSAPVRTRSRNAVKHPA